MRRFAVPAALGLVLLCAALRPGGEIPTSPPTASRRRAQPPEAPETAPLPSALAPEPEEAPASEPAEEFVEAEGVLIRSLKFLMRAQNADGSWGADPASLDGHLVGRGGLTSLAVLSFLAAGYSHLSKDRYGGLLTGNAVRRGLAWLHGTLGPDGRVPSDGDVGLEQALGAFALSEAYGLTGSNGFREPAERSLAALWDLQSRDGSWGSRTRTDWASEALYSARICDLGRPEEATRRLRGHYELRAQAGPDPGAALFEMRMLRVKGGATAEQAAAWVAARPAPATPSAYGALHFQGKALALQQGWVDPLWKGWKDSYLRAHDPLQLESGGWPGSGLSDGLLATCLAILNLDLFVYKRPCFSRS